MKKLSLLHRHRALPIVTGGLIVAVSLSACSAPASGDPCEHQGSGHSDCLKEQNDD